MIHVDAHVHVWSDDFANYPLGLGISPEHINPRVFTPREIIRLAKPNGVNKIVLIQMSYYGFDNSYMLSVIENAPHMFRGVALVDWTSKEPDKRMRELAGKGVRGFRIYPDNGAHKDWLGEVGFERMFRCASDENLALCPLIDPDALPALASQCERFPDTPVFIDHMARIGADGTIRDSDIKALCALAGYPQVKIKTSAFYALGTMKPPHLDLVPLIKRIYEAYGPSRLMWGSDCPFQLANESYEDSISLIRDHLHFFSTEDIEWMLRRTAEEFFFT